jgi:hypothetical protein
VPTNTYTALATVTLGGSDAEIIFGSIPTTYRDLVLVVDGTASSGQDILIKFNGDASNYSRVYAYGPGSGTNSNADSSNGWGVIRTSASNTIMHILDYSATNKHKQVLSRLNGASDYGVAMIAGRWASTTAINSITAYVGSGTFSTGTTFSLYGVIA